MSDSSDPSPPRGGGGGEEAASVISDYSTSSSEDNRIRVVCRVRPPVSRETHGRGTMLAAANRCVAVAEDRRTVILKSKPGKSFTFDYAAGEDSTQEELFAEVGQPVTEACLEGYNGTIFCYGQTGSGKTFTTFGPGAVMENHLNPSDPKSYELRGLVPRVLEYLYASIGKQVEQAKGKVSYSCRCSFYEIFNEKVFDLVDDNNRDSPTGLTVREDTRKGVYVEGLMEEEVDGADAACEILHRGFRNRHVHETAMNRESSRSHAVFTLVIKATEVVEEEGLTRSRVARFNLVDLAGSERQKNTQTSGERLKEASNINKSLSTLGQVINALVEKSAGRFRHIHYRDSKLTFLLRDSLGGNSKTMLVAAISPADQNFGETLSTLKFAQRAKMIKNQAVKNEDTSGSFDALRREVTSLRQKLLAAQQLGPASTSGAVPRPLGNENVLSDISGAVVNQGAADGGGGNGATDVKSEALLANALRRARAAGEAQRGAGRRVESLLAAIEKSEKDVMQLKMVIKFRDGTIAAQRKKDSDQERKVLAEENAHLRKELEGGAHESTEVSKWRMQCKEAEARLAELTGGNPGDVKSLVWGVGDEERFRGGLDEKVLELMEINRRLAEEADTFQERLQAETKRAEKRRLSAANRAELEAKKIVENALLSKLQEAQRQAEETSRALRAFEEQVASLEADNSQLRAAVLSVKKQLDDAKRKGTEAVQDRNVRLSNLQSKIEELSREKVRAVEDSGSEVASLELKLATAIKDNGELLRRNRALEDEADGLDHDLERLEDEKRAAEEAANETKMAMAEAIKGLEERMQQQEEAHERDSDEHQAEKRSLMRDVEAVTERLKAAEEAHGMKMEEQQRRSNDLQERLVEIRALKEEVEGRLKQLQDDYDTLSQQAEFSADRADELESSLATAVEDLRRAVAAGVARACVAQRSFRLALAETAIVREDLQEVERRAEGETFFRAVQERLAAEAREVCVRRGEEIEYLAQELDAARRYATAISRLLDSECVSSREVEGERAAAFEDVERLRVAIRETVEDSCVGTVAAAAFVEMVVACEADLDEAERRLRDTEEERVRTVQGMEQAVAEFARCEAEVQAQLRVDVETLQLNIQEMELVQEATNTDLTSVRSELEIATAKLAEVAREYQAQSQVVKELQTAASGLREQLACAKERELELEASVARVEQSAAEASERGQSLEEQLENMRGSCFEFQARTVGAEELAETLSGEVARLSAHRDMMAEDLVRCKVVQLEAAQAAEESRAALEAAVTQRDLEKAQLEADLRTLTDELRTSEERLGTRITEIERQLSLRKEELAAANATLLKRDEEVAFGVQAMSEVKQTLKAIEEELDAVREGKLSAEIANKSLREDLAAARSNAEEVHSKLALTKNDLAALEKETLVQQEELAYTGKELAAAVKKAEATQDALEDVEEKMELAAEAAQKAAAVASKDAEASAEELRLLRGELASAEERLSAKAMNLEAAKARVCAAESQVIEAGQHLTEMRQRLQSLEEKAAKTQEAFVLAAERLAESDAVQKQLACRVYDLTNEVMRLEGDTMSGVERAKLLAKLEDVTSRNTDLVELMDAMKEQTEGFDARVKELQDINVKLVGHKNSRQKIQQVQKLKDENNVLTRKVKELDDRLFAIKRSGCGPGCGRNSSNSSSNGTNAANNSVASSPAASPTAQAPSHGRGGGEDSGGKTYNLRRRGKTVVGAGDGAGRGGTRRVGLRDMTNAN